MAAISGMSAASMVAPGASALVGAATPGLQSDPMTAQVGGRSQQVDPFRDRDGNTLSSLMMVDAGAEMARHVMATWLETQRQEEQRRIQRMMLLMQLQDSQSGVSPPGQVAGVGSTASSSLVASVYQAGSAPAPAAGGSGGSGGGGGAFGGAG